MTEDARVPARLLYSPAVDVERHVAALARLGIETQSLPTSPGGTPGQPSIYLISTAWWAAQSEEQRQTLREGARRSGGVTIAVGAADSPHVDDAPGSIVAWLQEPIGAASLRSVIRTALETIKARTELAGARAEVQRITHHMEEVQRVGIALSAEKNLETLQHLILRTSRESTKADAGTLYLVEEDAQGEKSLIFQYSQTDSIDAPYQRQIMPLSTKSASGYVAVTGRALRLDDAYDLPEDGEPSFNKWYDNTFGYRTKSILVVPMTNRDGTVVGVIQLINRKKHFDRRLTLENTEEEVEAFSEQDERLLLSFASQAAIALENQMLIESIERLFAGFVRASVTAIEARDPTTFGHSGRVARLTVGLAEAINETHRGQWQNIHFSPEQIKEIEYAGLLHDFGKVGVREQVLVKPKKLYEAELSDIRNRFHIAREQLQNRFLRQRLDYLLLHGAERYQEREPALRAEYEKVLADLDEALQVILQANEPTVLEEERFQWLFQVAERTMVTAEGHIEPLVSSDQLGNLAIRKGTLNEDERREIESHVTHSFNFLIQIPWTKDLKGIPTIAYAHHEKLNGSGYPRKLVAAEIPVQTRMMTIADIFDALTASDRPYKPALPTGRALDILGYEVQDGSLDADLLDLFIERQVYRVVLDEQGVGHRAAV